MVLGENQYLPTKDDLENDELKSLAERFKSDSIKETLTNILEWQERNLQYWFDRSSMFFLLYFLMVVSLCLLPIPNWIKNIISVVLFLTILVSIIDITSILISVTLLSCLTIVNFVLLFSTGFPVVNRIFSIYELVALSITFGSVISLWIYLMFKYKRIKSHQPEFRLKDIFEMSLPIKKIIKYRLAICRDYAKFTAALLLNLYPIHDVYFLTFIFPGHSAAAIKIGKKIYALDQRLPILTLEKWLILWREKLNKKKIKADILKMVYEKGKIKTRKVYSKEVSDAEISKINVKSLTDRLAKELRIKQIETKCKLIEPPLRFENYAICYDNDEIVEFSLIKSMKNKLDQEYCGNLNKISKIEIIQDNKDLILKVWMK